MWIALVKAVALPDDASICKHYTIEVE